ncbi:hypothetical protein CPC16_006569, partial [Podila verticillata]
DRNTDKVARDLMARLRAMDQLQELVLRLNDRLQCSVSPFFDLAIGIDNRLEQLSCLLRSFKVSELVHRVGAHERARKSKRWP